MDDNGIVAVAGRVLTPLFPIEAGPYRLARRGPLQSDKFALHAELTLERPDPTTGERVPGGEGTLTLARDANARGEQHLTAFLEGWAAAVKRVLAGAAAAEPRLRPRIYLPDLAFPDPFLVGLTLTRDAKTAADYEAAVLDSSRLGRLLRPDAAALGPLLERLTTAIRAGLPVSTPSKGRLRAEYRVADAKDEATVAPEEWGLGFLVEIVIYDEGGLRDLKQQRVILVPWFATPNPERCEAFVRGWTRALKRRFDTIALDAIETLMPHDFAEPDVLELKKPITEDDFHLAIVKRWKIA